MNLVDIIREEVNNLFSRFLNSTSLVDLLTLIVMILFWLLLGYVVIKIVRLIILKTEKFQDLHTKQGMTMRRLINNIIRSLFFFWIALMILNELGIDILPVLAGAGVVAFAVGFGAQELIKDVIGGFFLILEKTFSIGDTITIGSNTGVVEDIGLRRTKIKNWKGEIITINNGDIKTVINLSINPSIAVVRFKIDFRKDINIFETEKFKNFVKDFAINNEDVLDEGSSVSVYNILEGDVTLQITFTTNIRKNVGVERAFMKELLKYTRENEIDLEVPVVLEHDNLEKQ